MTTISRNDKGTSNWQSYHNAAFAAVGYALNDNSLINKSINGNSGFIFQLQNSMQDDGIWYENSLGKNFLSLQF